MNRRACAVVACVVFGRIAAATAFRDDPAAAPAVDRDDEFIKSTQLAMTLAEGREQRRFRATVLDRRDATLTLLTAGHCMSRKDENKPVRFRVRDVVLRAKVLKVVPNPFYRDEGLGDAPGSDNALVRIELSERDRESASLRLIHSVELTRWPIPDLSGAARTVRAIDQKDRVHLVKAGNYANPRWLEWGSAFRPIPGDSGGGVFVVRADQDGRRRVSLIGAIVIRGQVGGGASLLNRGDDWVREALRELTE